LPENLFSIWKPLLKNSEFKTISKQIYKNPGVQNYLNPGVSFIIDNQSEKEFKNTLNVLLIQRHTE
jgi:hypothetical protein